MRGGEDEREEELERWSDIAPVIYTAYL